jgi:hypothetical protein
VDSFRAHPLGLEIGRQKSPDEAIFVPCRREHQVSRDFPSISSD